MLNPFALKMIGYQNNWNILFFKKNSQKYSENLHSYIYVLTITILILFQFLTFKTANVFFFMTRNWFYWSWFEGSKTDHRRTNGSNCDSQKAEENWEDRHHICGPSYLRKGEDKISLTFFLIMFRKIAYSYKFY